MVRWLRWHCPPDTGFEIRALAVWGRARYLSVTEAPHNTNFHTWMGKKHFCFFQTAVTGNRTPNSGVKGSGANHYPRAPALKRAIQQRNNQCWASVANGVPTLKRHWWTASWLLVLLPGSWLRCVSVTSTPTRNIRRGMSIFHIGRDGMFRPLLSLVIITPDVNRFAH